MTRDAAEAAIAEGAADYVAFGKPFVANPDLVERFHENLPLADLDPANLYSGGFAGYLDYPSAAREPAAA